VETIEGDGTVQRNIEQRRPHRNFADSIRCRLDIRERDERLAQ
jgi:hypothetical protein